MCVSDLPTAVADTAYMADTAYTLLSVSQM